MRGAAPGLSPISQQTIVSPGGNIPQQQSPVPQQPFQDPNAPPQFQRIQIQQAAGQKPMPQANMVVQKPFAENTDQVCKLIVGRGFNVSLTFESLTTRVTLKPHKPIK